MNTIGKTTGWLFFLAAFSSALLPFAWTSSIKNPHPLTVERVYLSSHDKATSKLTLDLTLAPLHKAYVDMFSFEFSNPDLKLLSFTVTPSKEIRDKFSNNKKRMVFYGKGELQATLEIKPSVSSNFNGALIYQACTTEYCLLPQKASFQVKAPSQPKQTRKAFKLFGRELSSTPLILLFIFAFGFLTAFTPCVFPMIPITMGILGFSQSSTRLKGFSIGLAYSLGLSMVYAQLGLLAAYTGGFIGQAFTHPLLIWSIFGFYVITALAMMGVFSFKTPLSIEKLFSRVKTKGLWGAFVAGGIAGVVASPCVGPAVAAVMAYVAQSGSPLFGFSALFTYGMGLGLLFVLIGTFYGELNHRIKPGAWLSKVKYIMGGLILVGAFLFVKPYISFPKKEHSPKQVNSTWVPFTKTIYDQAVQKGDKPIIIDFYADWCSACKELDAHTFSHPEFQALKSQFYFFKFDATKPTQKEQGWLSSFEVFGLPTLLFIDQNGTVQEDLTLTGFEKWHEFKKRLQKLKLLPHQTTQ